MSTDERGDETCEFAAKFGVHADMIGHGMYTCCGPVQDPDGDRLAAESAAAGVVGADQ